MPTGADPVGNVASFTATKPGIYTVKVKVNATGCESTVASTTVTEDKNVPTITATGGEITCAKPSVTLSATNVAGATYVWTRDGQPAGDSREVSVNVAGTYTVTVTFANGCTTTTTAVVTEDKNVPTITATGGEITCAKPSVTLSATNVAGATYVWTRDGQPAGDSREVSVNVAGTYTVTVTFANGCTTTTTAVVTQDINVPGVVVETGKLTCEVKKTTVVVVAQGDNLTYTWSVPNGVQNPGNVASFETEKPGLYSVEVTFENGCKASDQITVVQDITQPNVSVGNKIIACNEEEVTLTAETSDLVTYSWTGPNNFNATSKEITVTTVGTYTVTVSSITNGCEATDQGIVTKEPNPGLPQTTPNKVCFGEEITLTATCATGEAKWYADADLTEAITVLTFVPEKTSTYYAVCATTECVSGAVESPVTVTPKFEGPELTATPEEIVDGETSTLSGTCETGTLVWYKDAALTEVLGTEASLVVKPNRTTTYYAACEVEDCKESSEIEVKVISAKFDLALKKTMTTGPKKPLVKIGDSVKFTISVYNQGNVDATGIQITDYVPAGLTLEDNAWEETNGKATLKTPIAFLAAQDSISFEITFKVDTSAKGSIINTAEISAAGNDQDLEDIDSTPDDNPNNDGEAKDDEITENGKEGGDEDDHDIEEIIVRPTPPVFDGEKVDFCVGELPLFELGACAAGYDLKWYKDVNGTEVADPKTASPTEITKFYARCEKGKELSDMVEVTLTPIALPSLPITLTQVILCNETETTLTATCTNGAQPVWYKDAEGTDPLLSATVSPTEPTTYFARCETSLCESEFVMVRVIPTPKVEKPVLNNQEVCEGTEVTLTGQCATGSTIKWYEDLGGTTALTVTTFTAEEDKTYYARCETTDCNSEMVAIKITIKECVEPIFDLALRKTIKGTETKNPTVYPGSSITFNIEVFNQGTLGASNIEVTDYIPEGLELADSAWTLKSATQAVIVIDTLAPQTSVVKEITFIVSEGFKGKAVNAAEISAAEGGDDIDSTPDNNPDNDGDVKDDKIDENGKDGGDEDDHDIEEITVDDKPFFDLALKKTIKGGGKSPIVKIGDSITFEITLYNQGTVEATEIQVVDYIPVGLTLTDTTNWEIIGGKAYLKTPVAALAKDSLVTLEITFVVNNLATGVITNIAEISGAKNSEGLEDRDSTPDDISDNDGTPKDDQIYENRKANPEDDEDDHDIEEIVICPTGKCISVKVIKRK